MGTTALAAEQVTIGVMEFTGKVGISQEKADVLADVLAAEISQMGNVRVVSKNDITAMLNLEKKKRLAGCDTNECLADISGALGVRWMVAGNIALFGSTYIVNVKLVDVRNALVVCRVTRRVKGDEGDVLDEIPGIAAELFEKGADSLQLIRTVTVASKRVQLLSESPSAVTVFTKEDIKSSGAATLTDLLRRVPGFDVYELKPSYPLVGARALTESTNNLVLVLIDGHEVNIELSGFALWNAMCYDLDEVERVEVIRGPGSALYGANAFAAVVSIITTSDRPEIGGDVHLSGGRQGHRRIFGQARGSFDVGEGVLSFKAGLGAWGIDSPSDTRETLTTLVRTHGWLRYRQGRRLDLSLHAGLTIGDGWFYVSFGDMLISDAVNPWVMAQANVRLSDSIRLKTQVYYVLYQSLFHWRLPFRAYDIWIADLLDFTWHSPTIDAQLQLDWQVLDNLLLIGGANIRYTTLTSPELIVDDDDELRAAGFIHLQWNPVEALQLTGGIRYDINTDTEAALSPRVALVWRAWPGHNFRLSYGLAFRKPSHYEHRWHPRVVDYNPAVPEIVDKVAEMFGNGELGNETVHSFEAGWQAQLLADQMQVSLNLFYNLYRDTISFVIDLPLRLGLPDIAGSTARFENAGARVRAVGGEAEIGWRGFDNWYLWGNIGYRHVLDQDRDERSLAEPSLKANVGGRYLPDNGLFVDLALHYTMKRTVFFLDPNNVLNPPEPFALKDQYLLIGRLGYRLVSSPLGMLECGLTIRTPLGSAFREYPGMPMPDNLRTDTVMDFAGEEYISRISLYLRGSF